MFRSIVVGTDGSETAGKAVNEAGRTNDKIQSLAVAAQKIGDVVKLINDIAGQTNACPQRHDRGGARRRGG